jgi:hypothetical protein
MAMRLAFAVATNVDPDVLVVDEALAVGDGYFQKKCVDKIREIKERGTTILFCSHAMYYVTMFCERALWLANGRVEREGPAQEVVEAYEAHLQMRDTRRIESEKDETREAAEGRQVGRIVSVRPGGAATELPLALKTADELVIDVDFTSVRPEEPFHLGITLDTLDGRCVFAAATNRDGADPFSGNTRYGFRLRIPSLPISTGTFHIYVFLLDESGLYTHDQVILTEALRFESSEWTPSLIDVDHQWERR